MIASDCLMIDTEDPWHDRSLPIILNLSGKSPMTLSIEARDKPEFGGAERAAGPVATGAC
jgi:hypothetical protein